MNNFDEGIDYYKVLGLDKKASISEIRDAYKKKLRLYHPDKHMNKPIEERLQIAEESALITKAFKVLSDEETRREYDKSRAAMFYELKDNFEQSRKQLLEKQEILPELKDIHAGSSQFQDTFNKIFESQKQPSPNDQGAGNYGKELAPRRNLQDGLKYNPNDIEKPERLFEPGKFDNDAFNKMFEHMNRDSPWGTTSIIRKKLEEPQPLNGDLVEGTDLGTPVSSYGGLLIVGQDRESFDSVSSADYLGAFGQRNPTLNEFNNADFSKMEPRKKDKKLNQQEMEILMQERMRERGVNLVPTERNFHAEMQNFLKEKESKIIEEQKNNKEFVRKYAGQFPTMLLDQAFNSEDGIRDEFNR